MDAIRRSMSRDYNRGLPPPVRWVHAIVRPAAPIWSWATLPARRDWALPLVVGVVMVPLLLPFDGWLLTHLSSLQFGGDVRRELQALQQYGQLSVSLIVAAVVALLDPQRTRRLLDWGVALGLATLVGLVVKMGLGRPRPVYEEPLTFLGPLGGRPLPSGDGIRAPVEFWADGAASLWSMPSSHTMAAAVMSVFLGTMYPRLGPLAALMVAIVAFGRMSSGAHYPSDVVAGACMGAAAGAVCVSRGWGVRLVDWIWLKLVDRGATPAWPAIAARERELQQSAGQG